jgi:hypothetical protein
VRPGTRFQVGKDRRSHVGPISLTSPDRSTSRHDRAPRCQSTNGSDRASTIRFGSPRATVEHHDGQACFNSLDEWLHTDIRGWTLAEHVDDDQFARVRERAGTRLNRFVGGDGRVPFAAPALIATATAP